MRSMTTKFIDRKKAEAEAIAFDLTMQKICGVAIVVLFVLSALIGD